MHTPQGVEMVDGQLHARDWWAIVFTPSFPYRFVHMLIASGLTTAFLVAGISALQKLRQPTAAGPARMLALGIGVAAVLAPVQVAVGDLHGLNTLQHQPAKIAAIEGVWHTERGAPLLLFAVPNAAERRNDFAIGIAKGASLILTHEADGEIKGLSEFADGHPPVAPVFYAFRVMVGIGTLMLGLSWTGVWVLWRKRAWPRWLLRGLAAMTFSGWAATLAGWVVTEMGRQPWLIHGIVTTAEAASSVPAASIALTLAGYAAVYLLLIVSYMVVVTQLALKSGTAAAPGVGGSALQPRGA
jgi:cytochrome d ubiquinol oxidase subunit I